MIKMKHEDYAKRREKDMRATSESRPSGDGFQDILYTRSSTFTMHYGSDGKKRARDVFLPRSA